MESDNSLIIEEVKNVSLEMLKTFDEICKRNDIQYFVGYGTLLGGGRHKGFIPWDDDIDLMMLRSEFDKLITLYLEHPEIFHSHSLNLLNIDIDSKSVYAFAKLCDTRTYSKCENEYDVDGLGVSIDIFPYDYIKDNTNSSFRKLKFLSRLNGIRVRSMKKNYCPAPGVNSGNFIDKVLFRVSHLFGTSFWVRLIDSYAKKQKKDTGYVACKVLCDEKIFPSYIFKDFIGIEFEGGYFSAPKEWDEYLRIQYGDYMTPPPLEQQIPMHNFKAYWKEKNHD